VSFEQEIHGKLGHLSRALSLAVQVIAEIERDLARSASSGAGVYAMDGEASESPLDAPVFPGAHDGHASENAAHAQDAAAGRASAEAAADATRLSPPWAVLVPPWAWPGAAMWWPALFGGWPLPGAAPWAQAFGPGTGTGPAPFGAWPQPVLPWWSSMPPVWPGTFPASPRPEPDAAPVDRASGDGTEASDEPRRSRAGDERADAAAARDAGPSRAASAPDGTSPERSPDPWTWRWTNAEDLPAGD
jgi:hypothetical protein